jgi:hypothetical protein
MEDVVGVEHHVEIQPSPEQLDAEAAQRHVARLSKMVHEYFEKRKEEKKRS